MRVCPCLVVTEAHWFVTRLARCVPHNHSCLTSHHALFLSTTDSHCTSSPTARMLLPQPPVLLTSSHPPTRLSPPCNCATADEGGRAAAALPGGEGPIGAAHPLRRLTKLPAELTAGLSERRVGSRCAGRYAAGIKTRTTHRLRRSSGRCFGGVWS